MKSRLFLVTVMIFIGISSARVATGQACSASKTAHSDTADPISSPKTIPVIFHVVKKTDGTGNVSVSNIESQMSVLNDAYSETYYSFELVGVHYVVDNTLYDEFPDRGDVDLQPHTTDPAHAMNVFVGDMPTGAYGWGNFPDQNPGSSGDYVIIDNTTLPNGLTPPSGVDFDDGDILVHEVGHYLGLEHVHYPGFQCGTSSANGADGLSDTPACNLSTLPTFVIGTCPADRDSCTGVGFSGFDPIDNYMHVSGDTCRDTFTAKQEEVMNNEVGEHRADLGGAILYFDDDFVVDAGDEWNLYDATIKTSSGKKIFANGTLNAYSVTFEAESTSWNGIEFKSGSDGNLNNSVIKDVDVGWGGSVLKFASGAGIVEIIDSVIENLDSNAADAVVVQSGSTVRLYDNLIKNTVGHAISASNYSVVEAYNNDIEAPNGYAGIRTVGGADAYLKVCGACLHGANEFDGAGHAMWSSGAGSTITGGSSNGNADDNHICGTGSTKVEAQSNATISALYNWWPGGGNASSFVAESGGGSVDVSSQNTGSSSCSTTTRKAAGTMGALQNSKSGSTRSDVMAAIDGIRAGEFTESRKILQNAALERGDLGRSLLALKGLMRLHEATGDDSIVQFLEHAATLHADLTAYSLQLQIHLHARAGNGVLAEQALAELLRDYAESEYAFYGQLSLAHMYERNGNKSVADAIFGKVRPRGKQQVHDWDAVVWRGGEPAPERLESAESSAGLVVSSYPNPFNPTAVVSVQLPTQTHTTVLVLDVLGRVVATLSAGILEEGHHSFAFDASQLSSGIYIYEVVAGRERIAGAMYLVR